MKNKRFKNIGRKDKEPLEVDITSLLDILVILLVFLLKSYNASDLKLEVAESIELPISKSTQLGNMALIVQVDSEKMIWINNNKLGRMPANKDEKIDLLYEELIKEKNRNEQVMNRLARSPNSIEANQALRARKTGEKQINIVLDQSLPYEVLRKVMHTSALAGYPEFKFIVQGNF